MSLTNAQCEKIGIEMAHGQIFHSAFIRDMRELRMVFMVLAFADREMIESMENEGIVAFYEYMREALPRSINGMPIFSSCRKLTADENTRVIDSYNREVDRMKALDDDPATSSTDGDDHDDHEIR